MIYNSIFSAFLCDLGGLAVNLFLNESALRGRIAVPGEEVSETLDKKLDEKIGRRRAAQIMERDAPWTAWDRMSQLR